MNSCGDETFNLPFTYHFTSKASISTFNWQCEADREQPAGWDGMGWANKAKHQRTKLQVNYH